MNYQQLLSPNKNRFLRLLLLRRPDVTWEKTRFLGTAAAAREIPSNVRSRRKIPRNERKVMVEEYVNQYRMTNDGKYPTVSNVFKEVGGCYYKIRGIFQELKCNSNLSSMAMAAKNSTTGKANGTSDGRVIPDCQLSNNRTAVVEDCGISAESYSSYESAMDENSCQKMVDMSNLNENCEITVEYVFRSESKVDVELGGEHDRISADTDMRDTNRNLESHAMPVISNSVENTEANKIVVAFVMDDSELPAKPDQPSEVTGTSRSPEPDDIDEPSYQAFESDKFTRLMHVGNLPNVIDNTKQVGDPDSASIQALDSEVNKNSQVERTLDCQMRVVKTASVDDYQFLGECDSRSPKELDNYDCQKTKDSSNLIKSKEVTAEDFCRSERKATTSDDCEYSVKSSHPSEGPSTSQNTKIGNIIEASSQASECEEILRVTTMQNTGDKELQKSTLWGNLKTFASNILSIWQKT